MIHFQHLTQATLTQPSIVTIGVFDGVHRGHQFLISQLVKAAKDSGRASVVLTLFPHPDLVLRGQTGRYYLNTPEQKAKLLGDLGIDVVVTHPFDEQVRFMRAADFVDQLRAHLSMTSLWVTADFAMGYQREGNFNFLSEEGLRKGFDVSKIDLLTAQDNTVISSSAIRAALAESDVAYATAALNRPYQLEGIVVKGDQRGRTIGFPTANLDVWSEIVIPANGVYACRATINGETFMAVTNIGFRPTFGGEGVRIEAHLLDFNRDIYGQTVTLDFITHLRGEQKFSGLDALIAQITADAQQGRAILSA